MPFDYDAAANDVLFALLPRNTQRRLTFLDPRYMGGVPLSDPIPVPVLQNQAPMSAQPPRFIFHTAFCCSTLLVRALDVPGVSMGLKEPSVLVSLAHAFAAADDHSAVADALGVTLDLLARPLAPGETQIIKPSNLANVLARQMMALRPETKAVVIYSSLEDFLRSTLLKGEAGLAFGRYLARFLEDFEPLSVCDDDARPRTDLEWAAYGWLIQMDLFAALAQRNGRDRVRTLNCDSLLAHPSTVLSRVGGFFDLEGDAALWDGIAEGPVFGEHAKALGRPFDARDRRMQLQGVAGARTAAFIDAIDWTHALAARAAIPLDLGDTLLR